MSVSNRMRLGENDTMGTMGDKTTYDTTWHLVKSWPVLPSAPRAHVVPTSSSFVLNWARNGFVINVRKSPIQNLTLKDFNEDNERGNSPDPDHDFVGIDLVDRTVASPSASWAARWRRQRHFRSRRTAVHVASILAKVWGTTRSSVGGGEFKSYQSVISALIY